MVQAPSNDSIIDYYEIYSTIESLWLTLMIQVEITIKTIACKLVFTRHNNRRK